MTINMQSIQGFTDSPSFEDKLNRKFYVESLVEIIKYCNTPMTISISGEWGIGKTSFVNLIGKKIENEKNINLINFNIWQISQFEKNDLLKFNLFQSLVEKILYQIDFSKVENGEEKKSKIKNFIDKFNIKFKLKVLNTLEIEASNKEQKNNDGEGLNLVSETEAFVDLLNKILGSQSDRFIIFIDDLDRIDPKAAVEILEFLKLFLTFENCIYLLAIDEEVISEGLKSKYNELPSEFQDTRNYFEKLIQLPFYLPNTLMEDNNLNNYLNYLIGDNPLFEITNKDYVNNILRNTLGTNPRKIKRILNASWLQKLVLDKKITNNTIKIEDIIFIVCFQEKYNNEFNYFKEMIFNETVFGEEEINILIKDIENEDFVKILKDITKNKASIMKNIIGNSVVLQVNKVTSSDIRREIPIIFDNLQMREMTRSELFFELCQKYPDLEERFGVFQGVLNKLENIPIYDLDGEKELTKHGYRSDVYYTFE